MKIKFLITLSFCLLNISFINAQFTDFDLKSYRLPDIKTTSLDLGLNLNHSISNTFLGVDESFTTDNHLTNAGGAFSLGFYQFRNTLKYQGTQQAGFDIDPDYTKSRTKTNTLKESYIPLSLNLSSHNRFFSASDYFFGVDPSISYSLSRMSITSNTKSDKYTSANLSFSVPVSIGKGRIEPVEDARLAVYILDELYKNSRIGERPSDAVILEMASEISRIKRKRFFDSRIRKIEEMQVIDSFLVANNIVSKNDIVYFTRLRDMWDYASGPARNSGFSYSFGIANSIDPVKSYQENIIFGTDTTENEAINNQYNIGPYINIMYYRPVNLYWQSDLSFTQSYIYQIERDPLHKENQNANEEVNLLTTTLAYSLQYFPNSRTSASLSAGCQYTYSFGVKYGYDPSTGIVTPGNLKGNRVNPKGGLALQYYISPQVRLNFSWSVYLASTRDRTVYDTGIPDNTYKYDSFNNNFYLTFTYRIF